MKKLFSLLLVFVLVASILTGCGKSKSKETAKGTTEEITEAPTEPASRVPLIPIKDLGNIQFGMLEKEVNEAVKNNKIFSVDESVYYKYKGHEGTVDFEYENGFLSEIDIEFYGASEKLFNKLHKKYAKQYKVLQDHEEKSMYGVTILYSGFEGDGYAIALSVEEDEGKLSIHYGRL